MAVITWVGQGLFLLFSEQQVRDHFFYRDVLNKSDAGLDQLGSLGGQLTLVLGIAVVTTFIFIAAGTKSLGKVDFFQDLANVNT